MDISGQQIGQLSKVLRKAYDLARFDEMLRVRLDKNREDIALGDNFRAIVFRVIRQAEMENWVSALVVAAYESNPTNADMLAFSQQFGLAPQNTPTGSQLESIINDANSLLDIAQWREKLGQIEMQVCRVEIKGVAYGTGFLVGPDALMTNYHVVRTVIEEQNGHKPEDIVLRFDYKRLSDGSEVNPGTEYKLTASGWLIDHSPYDPVDLKPLPEKVGLPDDEKMDYALLRIDGEPAEDTVGQVFSASMPIRGWVEVPTAPFDFKANPALYIVQHPKGDPLKLAIDTDAVINLNADSSRVLYKTNTEPGSSGSPCFNQNWELVALHHGGDIELMPTWNEGIPMPAIMSLLDKRGKSGAIGE